MECPRTPTKPSIRSSLSWVRSRSWGQSYGCMRPTLGSGCIYRNRKITSKVALFFCQVHKSDWHDKISIPASYKSTQQPPFRVRQHPFQHVPGDYVSSSHVGMHHCGLLNSYHNLNSFNLHFFCGYLGHHIHDGNGQFEDQWINVGIAEVDGCVYPVPPRPWLRLSHENVLLVEVPVNRTPERYLSVLQSCNKLSLLALLVNSQYPGTTKRYLNSLKFWWVEISLRSSRIPTYYMKSVLSSVCAGLRNVCPWQVSL